MENEEKKEMTIDAYGNYVEAPKQEQQSGEKPKVNGKLIGIIAGVVAAVVVLILVLNSGGSAKGVVEKYCQAFKNYNASGMIKLMPKEMIDYVEKDSGKSAEKEIKEKFDDLKEMKVEITKYEILDEGKDIPREEIDEQEDEFKEIGMDVKDVSEAKKFKVKFYLKAEDEEDDMEVEAIAIKYKGKWCIFSDL